MKEFRVGLYHLRHSSWELYLILLVNTLVSFQFYILTTLTPLYFTRALKVSDEEAGVIFGVLGIVIGLLSVGFGSVVDRVGVKSALVVSAICSTLGFATQSVSENLATSLAALLVL